MEFDEASFKTRASAFLIFPRRLPCVGYSTAMHTLTSCLFPFDCLGFPGSNPPLKVSSASTFSLSLARGQLFNAR